MFFLSYVAAELRRRRGRTILTAVGLGIGVALVVTVTALSNGLDRAQSDVLDPLGGVGADMSVARPIEVSGSGPDQTFSPAQGPPAQGPPELSGKEQRQLARENGGGHLGPQELGKPGERFDDTSFLSANLSFPQRELRRVRRVDGVAAATGGLTLSMVHTSGRLPSAGGGATAIGPAPAAAPQGIDFEQITVSGVDPSEPGLGLITRSQVEKGHALRPGQTHQAVVARAYADREGLDLGDRVKVGDERFRVVGIAEPPIGGQASDVYLPLKELQSLSDRRGRVNTLSVRAQSADAVPGVASTIERRFKGADVTTAADLAGRISGSLADARSLSGKLGTALAVVALAGATLIASLLALSSVSKRTREIGTLKALGWSQWLVVRQIGGESLVQGALGGAIGMTLGLGAAALIGALGLTLDATVAGSQPAGPGPFGQGQVSGGSSTVGLSAPVDLHSLALAVALAALAGLIAGAAGGGRAARLRPAEALRSVE